MTQRNIKIPIMAINSKSNLIWEDFLLDRPLHYCQQFESQPSRPVHQDGYRTLDPNYRSHSRNQLDPYAAQPQVCSKCFDSTSSLNFAHASSSLPERRASLCAGGANGKCHGAFLHPKVCPGAIRAGRWPAEHGVWWTWLWIGTPCALRHCTTQPSCIRPCTSTESWVCLPNSFELLECSWALFRLSSKSNCSR